MPPSQEPARHRYALPSGHRVGDYRIEGFLGAGSFGITYLATDERLGRRVAIKEYLPSDWAIRDAHGAVAAKTQRDDEDLRWGLERFAEEARALARFDHPNVVRVHRYFTAHDTGFLVMEYVDGGSLGDLLRRKGTLSEAEVERHVLPVLDGLEQLHEAGLLHRDIKPDNIAVRSDSSPVLVDFGAARHEVGARSRALTSLVTPRYSPLEQYSTSAKQSAATDLYAFAAVLYRCVTGSTPLDAADRSLGEEQVPVSDAAKGAYSAGLLAAIDAALSPKMEDRPQSVGEFHALFPKEGHLAEVEAHSLDETRRDHEGTRSWRQDGRTRNLRRAGRVLLWSLAACCLGVALIIGDDMAEELGWRNFDGGVAPRAGTDTTNVARDSLRHESANVGVTAAVSSPWDTHGTALPPTAPAATLQEARQIIGLPLAPQHFTLGSHKDEVARIQGTPTRITDFGLFEVWDYGWSSVRFSSRAGTVTGWDNRGGNLKVKMAAVD